MQSSAERRFYSFILGGAFFSPLFPQNNLLIIHRTCTPNSYLPHIDHGTGAQPPHDDLYTLYGAAEIGRPSVIYTPD